MSRKRLDVQKASVEQKLPLVEQMTDEEASHDDCGEVAGNTRSGLVQYAVGPHYLGVAIGCNGRC